eukprot:CAMPEP_0194320662 /NCGR_PEP_ID=MMETSP0171-20130528/16933_1 /TAXON_ID=218684 /ORGANISM="Corethron pennatum, Strain L29A3" /LENGTH=212 /DNA_ID=CAMNT_0039078243 /DNA_START=93 /DNA_END=732 /DNA_ORIENTATION=-
MNPNCYPPIVQKTPSSFSATRSSVGHTNQPYHSYAAGRRDSEHRSFTSTAVPDAKRLNHSGRLCGSVYCHSCSSHKIGLPVHAPTGTNASKEQGGRRLPLSRLHDRHRPQKWRRLHSAPVSRARAPFFARRRFSLRRGQEHDPTLTASYEPAGGGAAPDQASGSIASLLDHGSMQLLVLLALGAVLAWTNMRDNGSYAAAACVQATASGGKS